MTIENNKIINNSNMMIVKLYIDGELASMLNFAPDPVTDIFNPMLNGAEIVHVENSSNIPTIGMKYVNNLFVEGDNGESYYTAEQLNNLNVEGIVAILDQKVVATFVIERYSNIAVERFFAAVLSDPTVVIENNYL
jgi:hypothetical protein